MENLVDLLDGLVSEHFVQEELFTILSQFLMQVLYLRDGENVLTELISHRSVGFSYDDIRIHVPHEDLEDPEFVLNNFIS